MGMAEAVVPRFHCEQDSLLFVEPNIFAAMIQDLEGLGYQVQRSHYMGCNQAVRIEPNTGRIEGGTDPREVGNWRIVLSDELIVHREFLKRGFAIMIQLNRVKEMMQKGEMVYGIVVAIPSPLVVEMAAFAGMDFAIIDLEHGAISLETFENMVRAAESSGICPFVRIRDSQPETILSALDRGAQGVLVPHMKTPVQASIVSQACRFYPRGNRGMAAGGRSSGFGTLAPAEFFTRANAETLLMPMIEDKEGVENIDAILSIEGIDIIMAGPGDLAQSYGYPGQPAHPKVQEAVTTVFAAAQKAGVPFCAVAGNTETAKQWREKGARCLLIGDDQRIVFAAFKHLLASMKG